MTKQEPVRTGGRPSRERAGQLQDDILNAATQLFLSEGYGSSSVEMISKQAGVSKRTFYSRFEDKAQLFGQVVHRLIEHMRPPGDSAALFSGGTCEEVLHKIGLFILHAALSEQALALHRLTIAEAARFPELARILEAEGARNEAITGIAQLLGQHFKAPPQTPDLLRFAAEQFLQLIIGVPQRRAMGLGTPMTLAEQEIWVRQTVTLFLRGL